MARELIHIRHHDSRSLLPRATANALAFSYAGTSQRPLERPQYQLVFLYAIKANPMKRKRLLQDSGYIRLIGDQVGLRLQQGFDLRQQLCIDIRLAALPVETQYLCHR
ncbi:hypothetical protein D3C81_1873440 [compost metagenome]